MAYTVLYTVYLSSTFYLLLNEWLSVKVAGLLAFEGDVNGAGAEDHEEELGKTAGTVLREEADLFVFCGGELKRLFVPSVIDKKGVGAGRDFLCDGLAEGKFGDGLAVERDDDFALLRVVRRVAIDGERGGHE